MDAFIAQYDAETRKLPGIAAEIAERLIAAGRAGEALATLDAATQRRGCWPEFEWEDARIAALAARSNAMTRRRRRWSCFERFLSAQHLRDYLKRLPDFDDIEAENRALDFAQNFASLPAALTFLASWPAPDRAAKLLFDRAADIDGDRYEVLTPAAEVLAGKHPLAATLALRAMILFSLDKGRTSRYKHAARHMQECASLASAIMDYGKWQTHEAFRGRPAREARAKSSFWDLVG